MTYIDDHIMDFDLQEALTLVSAQRRRQALRYRRERDQRLSVAAYRLLQHALLTEYGLRQPPPLAYGENGKPVIDGRPDIHFSMSHCHDAVAVVVSDTPVGIDIETTDQYDETVASYVMCGEELGDIVAAPMPAVAFTRLWTMKESLYKLHGEGGMAGADVRQLLSTSDLYDFNTIIISDRVCTVCRQAEIPPSPSL